MTSGRIQPESGPTVGSPAIDEDVATLNYIAGIAGVTVMRITLDVCEYILPSWIL